MTDKTDNDALVTRLEALIVASDADRLAVQDRYGFVGAYAMATHIPLTEFLWENRHTILAALRTPEVDGADAQADAELVAAYPELAEHTDDPWFAVRFLREKFERSEAELAIWKERAMTMRIEPTRPQPDETETLRAEVFSDGAVFTIRVELEHGVSGANSTQIHTSVYTKAGPTQTR